MFASEDLAAHAPERFNLAVCIAALLAASAPALAGNQQVNPAAATGGTYALAKFAHGLTSASGRLTAAKPSRANQIAGATITVTSCADDGGFDTLRHAVVTADPGDTIDLSGVACSKITLQSGAIPVGLADLTIIGPGAKKLSIDGNANGRVFNHSGLGKLTIEDLTVANGKWVAQYAYGGCIYSKGDVTLNRSVVTSCEAIGDVKAIGGAVVALGSLNANYSTLSANAATATVGSPDDLTAAGGAAFATEGVGLFNSVVSGNLVQAPIGKTYGGGLVTSTLLTKYSTLSDNSALSAGDPAGSYSTGGAAVVLYTTQIATSTIDHNVADLGGALFLSGADTATASIVQSTISSNIGNLGVGAIGAGADISISNSTIAFNEAGPIVGVGVAFTKSANLQSTIIADNLPLDIAGGGVIAGSNNLVKSADVTSTLPAGTITMDPKLAPLAFNGGITRTHAIGDSSPALNNGGNPANYPSDQRGPSYRRSVGASADIGAFEHDSDHIFGNGVDLY